MLNIDLTNDFVFRYIFGAEHNSDILLSLVNAVFESKGIAPATAIHPLSPRLPVQDMAQREGILDVHATDSSGRQFDLEIQVRSQKAYIKRSLFYLARMFGGQLSHGYQYENLVQCVGINFLDFVLFPGDDDFHHFFSFRDSEKIKMELSHDLTIHYLELPKLMNLVSKNYSEICNRKGEPLKKIEKWLYLMKEIDSPEDTMAEQIIHSTPEMERTKDEYVRFVTDDELRWEALSHEMWLHDQAQYRFEARQEGLAEGLAEGTAKGRSEGLAEGTEKGRSEGLAEGTEKGRSEGLAEGTEKGRSEGLMKGRLEAMQETAKKMRSKGIDEDTIRELTDFSVEKMDEF